MPRYNKTERLGVNKVEELVLNDLNWIFREQPIVDVGIDAIIEQSINDDPSGKFVAVQIKTGSKKSFHTKDQYLTYYFSDIHYNYWVNLNIPIILVIHLPETGDTYWQVINKLTVKKTELHWKLEIPKNQAFNHDAKIKIEKILSERISNDILSEVLYLDLETDVNQDPFIESRLCTKNLTRLHEEFHERLEEYTEEQIEMNELGVTYDDASYFAQRKKEGRNFSSTARRFVNEIELFSEFFADEIKYAESILFSIIQNELESGADEARSIILDHSALSEAYRLNSEALKSFGSIILSDENCHPALLEGRKALKNAIDKNIYEYITASQLIERQINNLLELIEEE
jgi:hypothetical protein